MTNYIALAIPVFFALIAVELGASRLRGVKVYRFSDSIADLSCGIVQQLFGAAVKVVTLGGYVVLYEHTGWLTVPMDAWWAWVVCFLAVDFCYYWFHRMSHELNFLWAAHVVHHQSEEYNLSVALRQSAFQQLFSWIFYLPLALVGFPPVMFATLAAFNTLYQFWIHTRLIDRLGPLEWILNTPSHHRVHHGQNRQYIDRNHAGTLIVWDRLFGTFEPEGEPVIYGVTEPSRSWNPLFVNLHTWLVTWRRARRTRRLVDKVGLWLKPPGWLPEDLEAVEVKAPWPRPKYDPPPPRGAVPYALVHFALAAAGTVAFLALQGPVALRVGLGIGVLAAVTSIAALLEARPWARWLELVRLPTTLMVAAALVPPAGVTPGHWAVAGAFTAASMLWTWRLPLRAPAPAPAAG